MIQIDSNIQMTSEIHTIEIPKVINVQGLHSTKIPYKVVIDTNDIPAKYLELAVQILMAI